MQLREACTDGVSRVAESVHERAHQRFHRPANVRHVRVRLHVMQQLRADQFPEVMHGRQLEINSLSEKRGPQ
eukprot:17020-Pleurochrysis_carterae.AAC.1